MWGRRISPGILGTNTRWSFSPVVRTCNVSTILNVLNSYKLVPFLLRNFTDVPENLHIFLSYLGHQRDKCKGGGGKGASADKSAQAPQPPAARGLLPLPFSPPTYPPHPEGCLLSSHLLNKAFPNHHPPFPHPALVPPPAHSALLV